MYHKLICVTVPLRLIAISHDCKMLSSTDVFEFQQLEPGTISHKALGGEHKTNVVMTIRNQIAMYIARFPHTDHFRQTVPGPMILSMSSPTLVFPNTGAIAPNG